MNLSLDVMNNICSYLSDKDKCNILLVSKLFNLLKNRILYTTTVFDDKKIRMLPFYNNFTSIELIKYDVPGTLIIDLPKNIKHLKIIRKLSANNIIFNSNLIESITVRSDNSNFFDSINPSYVKNLTLDYLWYKELILIRKLINVENIKIKSTITVIPMTIFNHNYKLKTVVLPNKCLFDHPEFLFEKNFELQEVTFGSNFDQTICNIFDSTPNLTKVIFKGKFNQSLQGVFDLCTNLRYLELSDHFNQDVSELLDNCRRLKYLRFGYNFDQDITGLLDNCVEIKIIKFGDGFNQSIHNVFNNCTKLENISFGKYFNQNISNAFNHCTNLKRITFKNKFNQDITEAFRHCPNLSKIFLPRSLYDIYYEDNTFKQIYPNVLLCY